MLSLFDIAALLLVLSAAFGWLNLRVVGLPHTIGLLAMALATSLSLIAVDYVFPTTHIRETFTDAIAQIDFYDTMMHGMLAFLLFAGALQIDFGRLRAEVWSVGLLATVGVLISVGVVGVVFWWGAGLLGVDIPLVWALVFGALISPTDPVAVLALLKTTRLPERLEIKIAGESLFNDGVGVVVFTLLLTLAVQGGEPSALHIGEVFLVEAVGGALLGLVIGYIAVRAMRSINDYSVEILITLGLVAGLYALALHLGTSGPIAVVVAGILVGNRGRRTAMSEITRDNHFRFWEVIDELLNSVLFLLIGLEILVIVLAPELLLLTMIAIPVVLLARLVSVSAPIFLLSLRQTFTPGAIPVLVWGGLRGGISVALALSLPAVPYREPILVATYGVVIFSIIVQGLTITPLVHRVISERIAEE
jgi:CPA1 family monovalent cation:H+ antiporter